MHIEAGTWITIGFFLLVFLLGSLPFGKWVAHLLDGKNLSRDVGNVGATHVTRELGLWPAGVLTLLFDVGKGAAPVALAANEGFVDFIFRSAGLQAEVTSSWIWFTAFFAVAGHCYSPWARFNGGKGVATAFGAVAVLAPIPALLGALGFSLTFFFTRISSLSSLIGLLLSAVVFWAMTPLGPHVWAGVLILAMILLRHESNIDALLEKREKAFS